MATMRRRIWILLFLSVALWGQPAAAQGLGGFLSNLRRGLSPPPGIPPQPPQSSPGDPPSPGAVGYDPSKLLRHLSGGRLREPAGGSNHSPLQSAERIQCERCRNRG